ncbi:uncharacterized protein LOC125418268 [Ziziphus jujuba]|uniref:Uncharacterized protein LOC125418268 n=1 Tax=Ziziphus jujuba TaxID=326968 RepID=A0ABM4A7B6_ZIZJJ|nr:uncharacterized protein LOC125418268 [Ziziphus jujuba]
MGAFGELIDAILFLFFTVIAVAASLIGSQTCLPPSLFPNFLVDLKNWCATEFGDYLINQKPHFVVGIFWLELVFQWPLALLNICGFDCQILVQTTCLMYGVSVISTMVPMLSELVWSGKASDKLLTMYFPFMGLGVLATLRGLLLPHFAKTIPTDGKKPSLARKKRA